MRFFLFLRPTKKNLNYQPYLIGLFYLFLIHLVSKNDGHKVKPKTVNERPTTSKPYKACLYTPNWDISKAFFCN